MAVVRSALGVLARHGGLVEVRLLKTTKSTISGYFNDPDALVRAVETWDGHASVYITLNPINQALLARAVNRLEPYARATTGDADILRRVWLPLDFDPCRPAGISATDAEVAAAIERRNEAVAFLTELGFPEPVTAMSGNGGHALYAVDLPNDEPTRLRIERALKAVAARFTDGGVKVDEAVYNAARIWKLYGTVAVKGDATADRPHRRAALEMVPWAFEHVPREALDALAGMAPEAAGVMRLSGRAPLAPIDLVAVTQEHGLYRRALHGGKHAVTCPWNAEHSGESGLTETAIFEPRGPGEPWGFKCQHAHCAARTIRDLLARLRIATTGNGSGDLTTAHHEPVVELAIGEAWPAPDPVPDDLPAVPAFDAARLLPVAFAPWVEDIAERAQCPPDFVAVAAVVAVSAVIGRRLTIRPKRHDDWAVVPNL